MTREPDAVVAYAINMASICQALHCLPREGGLLDQDARDVYMIECVLSAQAERQQLEYERQKNQAPMR